MKQAASLTAEQDICRREWLSLTCRYDRARPGLSPEPAIEPDANQSAADDEHAVDRDLGGGINQRQEEERGESTGDGGQAGLEDPAPATARAAVILGEMPMASRTGRHLQGAKGPEGQGARRPPGVRRTIA
jgi:hypothetical protein